jgi:hypothetical protein
LNIMTEPRFGYDRFKVRKFIVRWKVAKLVYATDHPRSFLECSAVGCSCQAVIFLLREWSLPLSVPSVKDKTRSTRLNSVSRHTTCTAACLMHFHNAPSEYPTLERYTPADESDRNFAYQSL